MPGSGLCPTFTLRLTPFDGQICQGQGDDGGSALQHKALNQKMDGEVAAAKGPRLDLDRFPRRIRGSTYWLK
jgi:hypothetical protein